MSTALTRSVVMFWSLMIMSHLPPARAGMIESKKEFSITADRPNRVAIVWPISMSEPIGFAFGSKYSSGGYGISEQITSFPARVRAALDGSGITAEEGAALGAVLAAVLGAVLAATDAGARLAGAALGADVVADVLQAETVMARTASAAAAVRNERMQDLLQETRLSCLTLECVLGRPPHPADTGCSVAPAGACVPTSGPRP